MRQAAPPRRRGGARTSPVNGGGGPPEAGRRGFSKSRLKQLWDYFMKHQHAARRENHG